MQFFKKVLHEVDLTPTKLLAAINNFYKNLSKYKEAYKSANIVNGREKILNLIKKY